MPANTSAIVSVVIPPLNEETTIAAAVRNALAAGADEVIVADGGSDGRTIALARAAGERVADAVRGRGTQLNAGAAEASGDVLCFMHADVRLSTDADAEIRRALAEPRVVGGNFKVRFGDVMHSRFGESTHSGFLAAFYHVILQFGVYYGDSVIFCRRSVIDAVGGPPPDHGGPRIHLPVEAARAHGVPARSRPRLASALGARRHSAGVDVVDRDSVAALGPLLAASVGSALPTHPMSRA